MMPHASMELVGNPLKYAHFAVLSQAIRREQALGPTGFRILDIGCGPGNLATFCRVPEGARLFGVDLWPNQLRQAAAKDAYEGLFQINLVDGLPFVSESFDMVVCNEVLMYLPNAAEMLTEFYRVLAPGGKLFLYNPINWLPRVQCLTKRLTRKIYLERTAIALDVQSNWKDSERACRITYYSFQSLIQQISFANFHVTAIAGFRVFRNRIRLMTRLENYGWYRGLVSFLTQRYPHLASDLLVVAHKKAVEKTDLVCLDKAAA